MRTSDRATFKNCRIKWDILSPTRMNLEPLRKPIYLDFGTAIHAGLQTYYEPEEWGGDRDVAIGLAQYSFSRTMKDTLRAYLEHMGSGYTLDPEQEIEFDEHMKLGKGMLDYYFEKVAPSLDRFRPVLVEQEFEVPILEFEKNPETGVYEYTGKQATCPSCGALLFYQGRIDMLVEDEFGDYWVWDHKTAGQMGSDEFLENDQQITSYLWALQFTLGIRIRGFIYSQMLKDYPEPPKQNKNRYKGCLFSINKQMRTTYELALQTYKHGDPQAYQQGLYDEVLEYIKAKPNQFYRRYQRSRSDVELANCGIWIFLESQEFFQHDVRIYPNPSKSNCTGCWTRQPCLMMMGGNDWQYTLDTMFVRREVISDSRTVDK